MNIPETQIASKSKSIKVKENWENMESDSFSVNFEGFIDTELLQLEITCESL